MRYYVAMYVTSPELINGVMYKTNWWKKDRSVYDTWDDAEKARTLFMKQHDKLLYGEGNEDTFCGTKLQVWSIPSWNRLEEGFKHPNDRVKGKLMPKPKRTMGAILKDFNKIESGIALALKAAGL